MDFKFTYKVSSLTGTATREIIKLIENSSVISFAGGIPSADALPMQQIQQISGDILASPNALKAIQYGATEGLISLREQLVEYVKHVGIEGISVDNLLVVTGGQQGLDLTLRAFIDRGDTVLVEKPTYLAVLPMIKAHGGNAEGVKAVKDGLDLADLEKKIVKSESRLLYCVPTFSNPTGKTYSEKNRQGILELAKKYKVMVLEDDPYGRLRYKGSTVKSIKHFDNEGHVIYVSSFSKILSPGLRVGFVVAHRDVIAKLTAIKQGVDLHSSNLSQAIVSEFLSRNLLMPHIEKNLSFYRDKKDAMQEAVIKYMPPTFKATKPDGGLFIWGEFPISTDTVLNFPNAIEKGVAYIHGQHFYPQGSGRNTMRLNFSSETKENITKGIKILGEIFDEKQ